MVEGGQVDALSDMNQICVTDFVGVGQLLCQPVLVRTAELEASGLGLGAYDACQCVATAHCQLGSRCWPGLLHGLGKMRRWRSGCCPIAGEPCHSGSGRLRSDVSEVSGHLVAPMVNSRSVVNALGVLGSLRWWHCSCLLLLRAKSNCHFSNTTVLDTAIAVPPEICSAKRPDVLTWQDRAGTLAFGSCLDAQRACACAIRIQLSAFVGRGRCLGPANAGADACRFQIRTHGQPYTDANLRPGAGDGPALRVA